MIKVTWDGGPWDGAEIHLPVITDHIDATFPEPNMTDAISGQGPDRPRKVRVPIRHGRAIWAEREELA